VMRLGTPRFAQAIVADSPLRQADPRTKLALCLVASMAVMLPVERLIAFVAFFVLLVLWARLLPQAAQQIWRVKWLLIFLFLVDWWVVSLELAIVVSLRLALMAAVFVLFVGTTTPRELCLALERMRVPYRYAFGLSLAFQSVGLLETEWFAIQEAQRARGAVSLELTSWKRNVRQVHDLVALVVPAIVLTTRRAWEITEAAYARGFDAPHRVAYRQLEMRLLDWLLLSGTAIISLALMAWK
jgi:energy-coupling factor transport system permease protein